MAPIGEKTDRNNVYGDTNEEDADQNLWANILEDVQNSSSKKLPSSKSVLVLGENESGKTSLIAKLQGNEDPKKGAGLEYHYIDVKDEDRDDQTRLGVWILDGDPYHSSLLKFTINETNMTDSFIMLVASMATPWTIMESLKKWSSLLQNHVERLRIPREKRQEYEDYLQRQFQEYQEPDDNIMTASTTTLRRTTVSAADEEKVLLPLGETTLTHNLGIPVVVVITKTDYIQVLEKEHEYKEEHFDFIQQHIRKFCLNFGAALFYVSVKEEKNCDLLSKYLNHRIYGFPFTMTAYVVEKDSVFIPAGWDNEKKTSILYENMTSMKPDDIFEDVIIKPITRKPIQRDAEVVADDEQVFLMKQQTQLSKSPAPGQRPEGTPMRPPGAGVQKPTTSPRVGGSPSAAGALAAGTPKKLDAGKAGATSEGVLANFFNSLLSKKTGGTPSPTPGSKPTGSAPSKAKLTELATKSNGETAAPGNVDYDRAAVSRDAAAELDRIRTKKPHPAPGGATQNSTASS